MEIVPNTQPITPHPRKFFHSRELRRSIFVGAGKHPADRLIVRPRNLHDFNDLRGVDGAALEQTFGRSSFLSYEII